MTNIKLHNSQSTIVETSSLKPRPGNRNHHPQLQIDRLAESYKYQGFRNPIIISNRSGQIVCGTGRLLAAKKAGLKQVSVIYQDYESDEQEYAHHVSDNALSLWSELDLQGINEDLPDLGPEFNISDLGIQNFTLDISDKNFDPNPDDDDKKKKSKEKECPHCGGAL